MRTAFLLTFLWAVTAFIDKVGAQVPTMIHYQGRVSIGLTNFNGTGEFKFALVNAAGTVSHWSHDLSSTNGQEPASAIQIPVTRGLYSILLGSTVISNMTPVYPTVFTNSSVWLRIWFNDGVHGFQHLSPDQRIVSVGYALMAAAVSDGSITSEKIAAGAVTTGKIENGAITLNKLASNVVTTIQSATDLTLGSTNGTGRLDVYGTEAHTAAISLIGSHSRIIAYGDDGLEQVIIGNANQGEILLHNNVTGNAVAIKLSANDANGGWLSLNNTNGISRVALSGANEGGLVTLSQGDGDVGIRLDGDEEGAGMIQVRNVDGNPRLFLYGQNPTTHHGGQIGLYDQKGTCTVDIMGQSTSTTAAQLILRRGNGTNTIVLDGEHGSGEGGAINLNNGSGEVRLRLEGDANNAGRAFFYNSQGITTLDVQGNNNEAALITLCDSTGASRITLNAEGTANGGKINVKDAHDITTVEVFGSEASGEGGQILIKQADGTTGIELDGDMTTDGGGAIRLSNHSGTRIIELLADDENDGMIALKKSNGTTTIQLDANFDGDGRIITQEIQITGGSDLSEQFTVLSPDPAKIEPGMVVCIHPDQPASLQISTQACDRKVAGILSGAGQIQSGMLMGQLGTVADGQHAVALTGRVYCKADAGPSPIEPGDLLTTSDTPGHAMKVTDYQKAQGAILGKAMTGLKEGRGLVLVLVSLQ